MPSLLVPVFLILLCGAGLVFEDRLAVITGQEPSLFTVWLQLGLWIAATWIGARILTLITWSWWTKRTGAQPPDLLRTLYVFLIWLISLSWASVHLFAFSPLAFVSTSSVLLAIIGFSLRNMIADLFFGITMAIERPFEVGHWISTATGQVGEVISFNWRSTQIVTREGIKIILPNSVLANAEIVNYSSPEPFWRDSFQMPLPYGVKVKTVERLMDSAVMQVPESAELPRSPEARMVQFDHDAVIWELRFWVPDFPTRSRVSHAVHRAFLRNMRYAGITPARKREEIYVSRLNELKQDEANQRRDWISQMRLFDQLDDADRQFLNEQAQELYFKEGQELVRQGDEGTSLFAVHTGVVHVCINKSHGPQKVATLGPGDFFGEMSLLGNEPRSATIRAGGPCSVIEVTREILDPILRNNPDFVDFLAREVAKRQQHNAAAAQDDSQGEGAGTKDNQNLVNRIADGIRHIFDLSGKGPA